MEITWKLWKAGLQWNVGLENTFSTEILFSIRVLHTVLMRKHLYKIVLYPKQKKLLPIPHWCSN